LQKFAPETGMMAAQFGLGSGVTTTLIALISNAGPEDQAIATAGAVSSRFPYFVFVFALHHVEHLPLTVSYLFRSLGTVVTLSIGSSITQYTLRGHLRARLSGEDAEEVK
jgi:hypothetical protein